MTRRTPWILLVLLCLSCTRTDGLANLTVDGLADLTFDGYGTKTASFTVTADGPWHIVKKDLSWLVAEPADGEAGTTTVRLSAVRNLTQSRRTGTLSITGGHDVPTATFSQEVGYGLVIYGLTDGKYAFDYQAVDALTFKVRSNTPWTCSASLPDWIQVVPSSGEAGETVVTVTASENLGAARAAELVLTPSQGEAEVLTIAQEKWRRSAFLEVTGADEPLVFAGTDAATLTLVVASLSAWTIESDATWLEIDIREGAGEEEGTTIHIHAQDNTDVDRSTTFRVVSSDPALDPVTVTVRQKNAPTADRLMAKWFLDDTFLREERSMWLNTGNHDSVAIPSDDDPAATFQYLKNGDTKSRGYLFSSGTGHYVVRPAYEGDCLQISVPIDHASAGTRFALRTAVHSSTNRSPANYAVEYLDGQTWKPCAGTPSLTFTSNKNPIPVDATATLAADVTTGTVVFRIRVSSGKDLSGQTLENSSSTMQLTQRGIATEPYSDYISVWQLPK